MEPVVKVDLTTGKPTATGSTTKKGRIKKFCNKRHRSIRTAAIAAAALAAITVSARVCKQSHHVLTVRSSSPRDTSSETSSKSGVRSQRPSSSRKHRQRQNLKGAAASEIETASKNEAISSPSPSAESTDDSGCSALIKSRRSVGDSCKNNKHKACRCLATSGEGESDQECRGFEQQSRAKSHELPISHRDVSAQNCLPKHYRKHKGSQTVITIHTSPCAVPVCYHSSDQPSSDFGSTSCITEPCCDRLSQSSECSPMIRGSRMEKVHWSQRSCVSNGCCPRCPKQQTLLNTVNTWKETNSKSKDRRIKARRIRHPQCEDSNSDTNSALSAPAIDVRALLPKLPDLSSSSSFYPSSLSTDQSRQYSNSSSRLLLPLYSSPISTHPFPGSCPAQITPCTSTSAHPRTFTYPTPCPTQGAYNDLKSSSSLSSDASSGSDIHERLSSTSSSSSSSDSSNSYSSSSIESDEDLPPLPTTYRSPFLMNQTPWHHDQIPVPRSRNPVFTYQNQHVGLRSTNAHGYGLPISSGDFWNVRRSWPRN